MQNEAIGVKGGISEVLLLPVRKKCPEHELVVHSKLGEKIADLLAVKFNGIYKPTSAPIFTTDHHFGGTRYFIPNDTLIGKENFSTLGLRDSNHFFGGIVSQPFMSTKAISHPLLNTDSQAPDGWTNIFAIKADRALLRGYTVFNSRDAKLACIQLLEHGAVRIKPVLATAGRGQKVIHSLDEFLLFFSQCDEQELALWGLTLEENLTEVYTYSVGQVCIAGITASYIGTQSLTRNNQDESVYGGSDLLILRGGYDKLFNLPISEHEKLVISQAKIYEQAAFAAFPDLIASRRNYDIAQGRNAKGKFCSGVLEQSWRIGGASAAEIFAIEAFKKDPHCTQVQASTHEIYGDFVPPPDAVVLYQGDDAEVGFITKFLRLKSNVYSNTRN